jgi:hypothetical protein
MKPDEALVNLVALALMRASQPDEEQTCPRRGPSLRDLQDKPAPTANPTH